MATSTTTNYANKVRDMYDKVVETAFVPKNIFSQAIGDKVWQSGVDGDPGDKVDFYVDTLLNPQTETASETVDPTPMSLEDSTVQVELVEHEGLVQTTRKLDMTTFNNLGAQVSRLVGINAAESTDIYLREQLDAEVGADGLIYSAGAAKSAIDSADDMTGALMRRGLAKLRGNNADPRFPDGSYLALMHPDVYSDLLADAASGGVLELGRYATPNSLFMQNEVGKYANFRILTSTNCKVEFNTGEPYQAATTCDVNTAAAATVLPVAATTGLTVGDTVAVTDNNGDVWAHKITAVDSGVSITVGAAFNKNGNVFRTSTAGLQAAVDSGNAVVEAHPIYTTYLLGYQALAYAWAKMPSVESFVPQTGTRKFTNVYWTALHGAKVFRADSCVKIYSGSTMNS